MNFSQAVENARNGHKVRRQAWENLAHIPGEYHYAELLRPDETYNLFLCVTLNDGMKSPMNLSNSALMADDWEIYTP